MAEWTEKELRKLKRIELLELMVRQGKEIDRLKAENDSLKEQLESRELQVKNAGSIAEAAMQIYRVAENAQKAVDLYVENAKRLADQRAYAPRIRRQEGNKEL